MKHTARSMILTLAGVLTIAVPLNGCGTSSTSPAVVEADLLSDSDASAGAVGDDVEQSAEVSSAGDSAETGSMSLTSSAGQNLVGKKGRPAARTLSKARSFNALVCADAADGTHTQVTLKRAAGAHGMAVGQKKSARGVAVGAEEITRKWSKSDLKVGCKANNHANIDWKGDLNGLKLVETFKRGLATGSDVEATALETSLKAGQGLRSSGSASVSWAQSATASGTEVVRTKTMAFTLERNYKAKNSSDGQVEVKGKSMTVEGSPLVIDVTRDSSSLETIKKRVIKSGKVISEHNDSKVEKEFLNVEYDPASECKLPISGSIKGKITKGDKVKEFTIAFGSAMATITYADGTTKELACEADEDAAK